MIIMKCPCPYKYGRHGCCYLIPTSIMTTHSQSRLLLFESFDLLGNTAVGLSYGILLTLYCLCAQSLYLQLQDLYKKRQARFTLAYTSFMLFCSTVYLISSSRLGQLAYIDNVNFPGEPLQYELSYNPTSNAYKAVDSILQVILEASTMVIQVGH